MGLIRKTLAVSTLGTVKGSSKKQRVARETRDAVRALNPSADDGYNWWTSTAAERIAHQMKPRAEIAAASNAAAALYNQALAAYKADPTEARHTVLATLHQRYAEAHALASSTRGVTVKGSTVPSLLPYPLPPLSAVEVLVAKVNADVAAYNLSLARYNASPTSEGWDAVALLHQEYSETLAKAVSTPGIVIKNPVAPMLPPRLP